MSQPDHEAYEKALRTALRLLRHRDRTEEEVRRRLESKGTAEGVLELVLTTLKGARYLDDARLADRAAELARTDRPIGRLRLESELRGRGTDEESIDTALEPFDDVAEAERAEALLRSRLKPDDPVRKSAAYLARRGFDDEVVRTVIERVHGDLA